MIVAIDGPAGAGQEHRRARPRRAARLPLPRHGRDVPRAHLARARARRRPRRRRRRSAALAPRTRSPSRADRVVDRAARTSPTRSASPRSTASSPRSRAIRRCATVMRERQRELAERRGRRHRRARHRHGRLPRRRGEGLPRRRRGRAGAAPPAERPEIGAEALATDLRLRDERDAAQMQAAPDATRSTRPQLTSTRSSTQIERLVEASAQRERMKRSTRRLLDGRQGPHRQP